ncbi:MAG: hypothetical protein H6R17_1808 [Proteobacteria bacterium]|nr:hypothetical protein [Pseudomonadota bacterium]
MVEQRHAGMANHRVRRLKSVKLELLRKSREAALAAVQVFNNPAITFKSEIYVVLMVIAWTYLLHAFYREKKIDYRYFKILPGGRKKFDTTSRGAQKHWELDRCLSCDGSPIDKDAANNLRFLIELRHEIEHQMTTRIDNLLSARFQACCLNYNLYIKKFFGEQHGIDQHLSFSLQFASLTEGQVDVLAEHSELPKHIQTFVEGFDGSLSDEEFNSPKFAYRVLFVAKTANNKGQADRVIEFIKSDSNLAHQVNATYALMKDTEKPKLLPSQIVEMMKAEGFPKFSMHHHSQFWKSKEGKNPKHGFGTEVVGKWYWYDKWVKEVRDHCQNNPDKFS